MARTGRPLILLVEDDLRAARGLARMLGEDGFEVECVAEGASAIARLTHPPLPDAVVTDHYMPYADGLSVASFARSRCPTMATVVVTGHVELIDRRGGEGAPTILAKPLDYDVLAQTLHRLLSCVAA